MSNACTNEIPKVSANVFFENIQIWKVALQKPLTNANPVYVHIIP